MSSAKNHLTLVLLLGSLTLGATSAWAESRYVRDWIIVTLRQQPASGAEVLRTLRTGTEVELLDETDGYFKVRTSDGEVGFVQEQYLTDELPKERTIARLEQEVEALSKRLADLADVEAVLQQSREELDKTATELEGVRTSYDELKAQSGEVLETMRERDALLEQNQELAQRVDSLQRESDKLLYRGMVEWFLAGGGVFFGGWLMGKLSRRKRSRF